MHKKTWIYSIRQHCLIPVYMGDENIPIGVLGMIADTLGVSECGNAAIRNKPAAQAAGTDPSR